MDKDMRCTVTRSKDTACRDCEFRDRNPLKTGICMVYPDRKPACVFRGEVCEYYEREGSQG